MICLAICPLFPASSLHSKFSTMFSHFFSRFPSQLVLTWLLLGLVASCSSSGSGKQYYLLTAEAPTNHKSSQLGLGIGPITIANYLDRPNLVFQQDNHQLIIAESHRWAGDLEDNLTRVIATNLGRLLGATQVRTYPWLGDDGLRYQITMDIDTLHANSEGDAVLEARWRVYSLPDRKVVHQGSWSGSEALQADGYNEMVAAQSRLIATLCDQVANQLRR